MSAVIARVLRQVHDDGTEAVILEKVLVLPDVPTMGTRLDLPTEGVEAALTVVGLTLRPITDIPAVRPTSIEVVLLAEPLRSVELANSTGWRDHKPQEPEKV